MNCVFTTPWLRHLHRLCWRFRPLLSLLVITGCLCDVSLIWAQAPPATPAPALAVRRPGTLASTDLVGVEAWSPRQKAIIDAVLSLSRLNLGYVMGSDDPTKGGLDCSGAVYRSLTLAGIKIPSGIPRSSVAQYEWLWKAHRFRAVTGQSRTGFEFAALQPGDLLFWTGTYDVADRDPPISHVMIYLGKRKDGREVMAGASDGRPYENQSCHGVGVFDFVLPKAGGRTRFVGYGSVPAPE